MGSTIGTHLTTFGELDNFLNSRGPFELAIWDFDGVVVDSEPLQRSCYKDLLKNMGLDVPENFFAPLIGHTEAEIWAILSLRYGIEEDLDILKAERLILLQERLRSREGALNWFVLPILSYLQSCKCRIGIVSSGNMTVIDQVLEQGKIRDLFDFVSAHSAEARSKANRLHQSLGDAQHVLVLEDSASYLGLARQWGATTIAVHHSENNLEGVEADAHLRGAALSRNQ